MDHGVDLALDWFLEIMEVNVDGLLEGDSAQARDLLTYLEMYERGDLEILAIDGEGPAGLFYELGAGVLNRFGDFTELCNLSLRHLDKTIETGHRGLNRFRRPTLEEAQWEELEDDIMNIEDEVLRENVLGVFWGGCERQFMARVGLPLGAFRDGLSLIRYMVGAKGNGSFSDNVKYGAQISLSMGFFFLAFSGGGARALRPQRLADDGARGPRISGRGVAPPPPQPAVLEGAAGAAEGLQKAEPLVGAQEAQGRVSASAASLPSLIPVEIPIV